MPPVIAPDTPLAKRAAPPVKLDQAICLRCSKRIGEGGENCQKRPLAKCEYCRRLKKECGEVPVEFRKEVNKILRLYNSRGDDEEHDEDDEDDALTLAKRSYVKDVEAFLRKEVKHGLTKRPKGDEIQLLQVQAMNRVAAALEGILDVVRFAGKIAPLGDADAPTDDEGQNPPNNENVDEQQEEENEDEGENPDDNGGGEGGWDIDMSGIDMTPAPIVTVEQEPDILNDEEGVDQEESPTVAAGERAGRRHTEGSDDAEKAEKKKKKKKKGKKGGAGGDAETPATQTTTSSREGEEVPADPPAAATTQSPRPRNAGTGVVSGKAKEPNPFYKKRMTLAEMLGRKGGKTPPSATTTAQEQGKRRRDEGQGSESSSPKKKRREAHKEGRIQKRDEKKQARKRPMVEEDDGEEDPSAPTAADFAAFGY